MKLFKDMLFFMTILPFILFGTAARFLVTPIIVGWKLGGKLLSDFASRSDKDWK